MGAFSIVVAEDDDDDFFILKESFSEYADLELVRFTDGRALLEYLNSRDLNKLPDVILLDLNMPEVDGLTTLKMIKSLEQFAAIPVFVYSTCTDEQQIAECFRLGASGFTTKGSTMLANISFARGILTFLHSSIFQHGA
jgi:CheY-like chemotaxis protein